MNDELEAIVTREVEALGYELFELRRGGAKGRPLIDVRIDRRDGARVTVDDCARVSRTVEARLEGSGVVPPRYVLEVSSPGMERRLRHVPDWRKYVGQRVAVSSVLFGGPFEGILAGLEGGAGEEVAILRTEDAGERRVPLAAVKEARLAFTWKR